MSIDIRPVDGDDRTAWNRSVERSPQTTPFHRYESLEAIAEHSDAELQALGGYKGQEPVGLFPVFARVSRLVPVAFSPPPHLAISYLGPALLNVDELGRRKRDRRHTRFIDGCVEWIDANLHSRYVHVRGGPEYDDSRPLEWNGFRVTPAHTYYVDLTCEEDEVLGSFSRDARSNIRSRDDIEYAVERGGPGAIRRIIAQIRQRHEQLGEPYRLTADFAVDLYEALPEGQFDPYELVVDGEPVGGMLVLGNETTSYRWQGGAKTDLDVPANDLLDWHVMQDARARGRERYDLVYADNPRINRYKSKFNPTVRRYFRSERGSLPMRLAASIYRAVMS